MKCVQQSGRSLNTHLFILVCECLGGLDTGTLLSKKWMHLNGYLLGTVIWGSMRENLSSGFANSKGADQPAHRPSLICAFLIRLS